MFVKSIEPVKFREFKYKVAIIKSSFNVDIGERLLQGALDYVAKNGDHDDLISIYEVAGAFEIPFYANKLIKTNKFDGILTLGCIIRGETAHFQYISESVFSSLGHLSVQSNIPIALGILTTYNSKQALDRISTSNNKGFEAMSSLHNMIEICSDDIEKCTSRLEWKFNQGFKDKDHTNFLRL